MTRPLTDYANTNKQLQIQIKITINLIEKCYQQIHLINALIPDQSLFLLLLHYNNTNNNKPNTNTPTMPTTNLMNNPSQSLHTYPQTHIISIHQYTITSPNTQNKTQPASLHSSSNYTPNTTTSTATTATHTTHTQPQSYTQQRATPYPVPYPHRAVVTTTQPYQPQTQHKTITAPQTRSAISKPPTTHNRTNTQPTQPTTQRYQYPPQYQHQTQPQTKPTVTTTAPQSQPTNTYPQPIITTTHPPTYQYPPPYQPPPNYPPTHAPPDDKLKHCARNYFGGKIYFNWRDEQSLIQCLSNGANPNQKIDGILLIRYFITDKNSYQLSNDWLNIINILLNSKNHKIDIFQVDKTDENLLETMVKRPGYFDLFKFIFEYYSKHDRDNIAKLLSYKDKNGNNLIMLSMMNGENWRITETIFEQGYTIDCFEQNNSNNDPFTIALKLKFFKYVECMIRNCSYKNRIKILKEYPNLFHIAINNLNNSLFCYLLHRTNLALYLSDTHTKYTHPLTKLIVQQQFISDEERKTNGENILMCYVQYISECLPGKFKMKEISSNIEIELRKRNIPIDISNMIIYYTVGDEQYNKTLQYSYEFNQHMLQLIIMVNKREKKNVFPCFVDLNIQEIYETYMSKQKS
eukprot:242944_1